MLFFEITTIVILQQEILHFQLSGEHVLIDDSERCKITGFGFKEHVLDREMKEEDEGVSMCRS